ncbi:GyrI-like domain-containing protein [Bryobacter aggregatus]|uniref:GyrI-like domain-containing protein n=1 Tax=Bryobacter aggregatus TaxID=360054 RepID=UPI0004E1A241|nr:GyrI-like domain-containing protein [Bryobacter aggregatus]
MHPKFISIGSKRILGLSAPFFSILTPEGNAPEVIPALWARFMARAAEIKDRPSLNTFGLSECLESEDARPGELLYTAGVEAAESQEIPDGMSEHRIPAGLHAVFTHVGLLQEYPKTLRAIYQVWLLQSGTRLRAAPHFEVYDSRFHADASDSEFDIYIPIEGDTVN